MVEGIPLSDLIDAVRAELEDAAFNARDQPLQFEVSDVLLEVEVATTGSREAEGGLKIWVLTVGAKGTKSDTASHKVVLNLTAVDASGAKFRVSDATSRAIPRT